MDVKNIVYKIIVWVFWGLLIFLLALSTNSYYNFRSFALFRNTSVLIPQGWGFFTKEPREDVTTVYEINNKKILEKFTKSNLSSGGMGISKNNRFTLYEASQLTSQIPKSVWDKKRGELILTDSLFVIHNYPNKLYFFEKNKIYMAVKRKPIPFIWANDNQEKNIPYQAVKFLIE